MLRYCLVLVALSPLAWLEAGQSAATVKLLRTPNGGIQPQAVMDAAGTMHLIYFKGDPAKGDAFYVSSKDSGSTFSAPLRINSQPGSVIAMGNIRGAHLTVGKNGRVHVAWMGSQLAKPQAAGGKTPMLYTRLNDAGTAFEPQRNVIAAAVGLDGGGSLAADHAGNVYVTWHAPSPGQSGEDARKVWLVHSTDDGKTFGKETAAFAEPTGACGCCGMRAFCDSQGKVYALYRSAQKLLNRDAYLLVSGNQGKDFTGTNLQNWEIDQCPMSTFALAEGKGRVVAAWETKGQVYFSALAPGSDNLVPPIAAPGNGQQRKHPALAVNVQGETLLVWTEGMGWNKGGSLHWCVFDKAGQPTAARGQAPGIPVWSLVTAAALPDGNFRIIY